jgi:hypothetical protein
MSEFRIGLPLVNTEDGWASLIILLLSQSKPPQLVVVKKGNQPLITLLRQCKDTAFN